MVPQWLISRGKVEVMKSDGPDPQYVLQITGLTEAATRVVVEGNTWWVRNKRSLYPELIELEAVSDHVHEPDQVVEDTVPFIHTGDRETPYDGLDIFELVRVLTMLVSPDDLGNRLMNVSEARVILANRGLLLPKEHDGSA